MKRSNMKSDIAVRSTCKPEGRIFPRRKVASKSHLLNGGIGDFEMELSLAIQESLKYAQQNVNNSEDSTMNNFSEDYKGHRASVDTNDNNIGEENEPNQTLASSDIMALEEVGRMKDLLLAQAEMIQCQQEEISLKDKELKFLRVESDNLQCRLTRMERRLSILKHKEESQENLSSLSLEGSSSQVDPSGSLSVCTDFKRKSIFHKPAFKKQHKRHRLNLTRKKCKWRTLTKSGSLSRAHTTSESKGVGESDREAGESSMEDESGSDGAGTYNESASENKEGDRLSDDEDDESSKKVYIDYPVMQTDTVYHMYYPKHLCPNVELKKIQERSAHQLEVETPSWRMNPLTNMYQLEGTENITDEAYFKRHQKFELEEKRRKRWDLQRLRELRTFEKFEEEKESALRDSLNETDVDTFLPSFHDLTHIEISSSIPVMAFGQPIPYVSPAEFNIPWEINNSPSNRLKASGGKGSKRH